MMDAGMDQDISGAIAAALCMRPAGTPAKIRAAMREVIESRVYVYEGSCPPSDSSAEAVYRRRLLQVGIQPDAPQADHRRKVLDRLCNGDVRREDMIEFYGTKLDKKRFAKEVARALLPRRLKVFARNRWMLSASVLAELCLLLNFHGIFMAAMKIWLGNHGIRSVAAAAGWDAQEQQQLAIAGAGAGEGDPDPEQPKAEGAWAQENKENRQTLFRWLVTEPGPRLLALCIAMQPQLHLFQVILKRSSERWDDEQRMLAAAGKPHLHRKSIVLLALAFRATRKCDVGA
jgi:hypothetical protein